MDDSTARVHWKDNPDYRGTLSIVTSCLGTLLICVWSAVHVDILAGRSRIGRYLSKTWWMIVGLLAPELLFLFAWDQLCWAYYITRCAQARLNLPPQDHATPSRASQVLSWCIGLSHPTNLKPSLSDIELQALDPDRCVVDNTTRRHPFTLVHGFYAVMGGYVLRDPAGVVEPNTHYLPAWQGNGVLTPRGVELVMERAPHLIPDIALRDILDRSKADALTKALLIVQVLWFCSNCAIRIAQGLSLSLLEISTLAHGLCAILTYLMWWNKPKDVEWQTGIAGPGAQELGAWMSISSPPSTTLLLTLQLKGKSESHFLDHDPSVSTRGARLRPDYGTRARNSWKTRFLFHTQAGSLPWYIEEEPSDSASSTHDNQSCRRSEELRWELASKAFSMFNLGRTSDSYIQAYATLNHFSIGGDLPFTSRELASLIASSLPRLQTRREIFDMGLSIGSMVLYGLPHLLAWSAPFPSLMEQLLWRLATLSITFFFMAYFLLGSVVYKVFDSATAMKTLNTIAIGWYTLCSTFLVVGSIRQLFFLPPDAFVLPSWGNYWPHFS